MALSFKILDIHFFFQDLHYKKVNGVSTIITKVIIHNPCKYASKNEKDLFSSKYLHIPSITKMAARQGVDFFDSNACYIHSIGNNQESYLDLNIPALTLPGTYSLNGWADATPEKLDPSFHWLGPHVMEQSHFLIKELYIAPVAHLKRYFSIYPILLAATTSLVMQNISVGTNFVHYK